MNRSGWRRRHRPWWLPLSMLRDWRQKLRKYQISGEFEGKGKQWFSVFIFILKSLTFVCVFHSVLQDTKAKIQKMKQYQERLMACLGDVLEKHVPHPQNEPSTNKKKKVQWPVCNHLCLCNLFTYKSHAVATPMQLTMVHFHFQNVTQEFDEDLISLNEILEVGFD